MKWYRCAHPPIFTASLAPLLMTNWVLWIRILLPVVVLVSYAINEVVIARRKKTAREREAELDHKDPMLHAYRESGTPPTGHG